MPNWLRWLLLGWILLAAATLRLTGLAWDELLNYHPDERFIAWVGTTIEGPERWDAAAFDPHRSPFNPFYWPSQTTTQGVVVPLDASRDFAYGHLPLYLGVVATRLAEWLAPRLAPHLPADWLFTQAILNQANFIEFDHITAVGRLLTALVDVGTVWLVYRLGCKVYGEAVGLLAAAFLALNVMHIQLAHFFAVDPYLTFFSLACLYLLVTSHPSGNRKRIEGETRRNSGELVGTQNSKLETQNSKFRLLLAGAMAGLAVGSKFAGILLVLPILVACWLDGSRPRTQRLLLFVLTLLAGFLAFFLTNPFALLDQTCQAITPAVSIGPVEIPALNWGSCYLRNVVTQGMMANGRNDLGYTRQYAGTTPYLYFLEMQVKWGMGPLLGLAAFIGLAYVGLRWLQAQTGSRPQASEIQHRLAVELILLAWVVPYALSTGNFYVKFMRYVQPITPLLMVFAAAMVWQLRPRTLRYTLTALILVGTTAYALAFSNIYQERHPWAAASAWIYANIPAGATIYSEQWDDPLPTSLSQTDSSQRASQYETDKDLTWLTYALPQDNEQRLWQNLELVAQADYLVISSHRVYGVIARQPERFPLSSQFHQLLFRGDLGYELVYSQTRLPHLGNFYLRWDTFTWAKLAPPAQVANEMNTLPGLSFGRADESFTVYDQPLPMIFANEARLTPEQLKALFVIPAE